MRPAKRYIFFVIASPVGAYHGRGIRPGPHPGRGQVRARGGRGPGRRESGRELHRQPQAAEAKARGYAQVLWTDAAEHTYLEEVGTMNLVIRIGDEL